MEIIPLRPEHPELPATFWEVHHWHIILAATVFLLLVSVVIIYLRLPRPVVVEPPGASARRALDTLRNRAVDAKLAAQVSKIVRRYVRSVFAFPPGEMTTTELCEALKIHPEIQPAISANIASFLRRCEEWKFAPEQTPSTTLPTDALALVARIETARQSAAKQGATA